MRLAVGMEIDLPYTRVERFDLDGKSYPTEEAVIRAAVEQVLGNPGVATSVLAAACALAPLLARQCQLVQAAET